MDTINSKRRSALMARIRAKNTAPEMTVRKMVSATGRRYRLHVRDLPGCPDLVFARQRKVIFVHGCFWHPHGRCPEGHAPVSRTEYWTPKLEGNRLRDKKNQRRLHRAGWAVLTIRECELREPGRVDKRLALFLKANNRATAGGVSQAMKRVVYTPFGTGEKKERT